MSVKFAHNEKPLNPDNMLQTETTIADMKNLPKYTVEKINYENISEKKYIYQLKPISVNPKAISTDSVETNDINMNNEVDSSLIYPVRRIRFGGRIYVFRRGFFRNRVIVPFGFGHSYYKICHLTVFEAKMCRYAFV
ncbi:hypothetical protein C2G38_2239079 [Gigaspora rosea]|uniref:Uncharacterized protein n=1 Tax=Gigaspora rosea TaxID=44941 RepID=A0A397W9N9_9GLOM|nr:hypothetical protein C2G38_2239079 [Gigaspora rosea]CAG8570909.1 17823_t:CDS:1 [Gigaspora rosea]